MTRVHFPAENTHRAEASSAALNDATAMLDVLIMAHHAAAIPATVAACVAWAVEHGGADLIRGTLSRAITMTDEAEIMHRRMSQ